ncbi:MAG: hydroxysqualene dehydroxylase HpnE [Piscinibacter sp.]|nr:hydroxysqualene dehydroxylase HpnE [Piscinibacter sp.]
MHRCCCGAPGACRLRPLPGFGAPHDAAAVRAGEDGPERLELLLRLPLPAAPAPGGDHRLLRVLPRGGRHRRRGARPGRGRRQAGLVAHGSGAGLRRTAEPPGDAGAAADRGRVRHPCRAPGRRHRRLPDGPGPGPLPGLRRARALLPSGRRRGRRGGGQHLRPHPGGDHRLCPPARAGDAAHQHHPRRRRRRPARAHLPADVGAEAVRRQGAGGAQQGLQRTLHGADAIPGRAGASQLRRSAGPAAGRRPRGAEAGPDDGQHLPHAAARDRGRRLPGAAPTHRADAAAQALDRDEDPLAGPLVALRVAVIGAGWAGLAAAVEARTAGHAVTVFEMAPQPGGRARDVPVRDLQLDNGQHILIGAYVQTLRLMRQVGVDPEQVLLRMPLRLAEPDGRGLFLPAGAPALAFARGVLGRAGWPLPARLGLLAWAGGWAARGFRCAPGLSVAQLAAGLDESVRRDLIEPLCVAALNTPADQASATVFLRVLKDALFAGPGSSDLLLPRAGLGTLFPQPAWIWLQQAGAALHAAHRVRVLRREGRGWSVDGAAYDDVLLAVRPGEAARLTADAVPAWSAAAAALHYEPIVTVYLRSPGTRLPEPMLALPADAEAPAQFVFDRGQLGGPDGLLAFVISGAQPWVERGREATLQATLQQARRNLRSHLRGAPEPVQSITERRATFRCTPGLVRPPSRIAPGLQAVGDYVDGPYPATLEGAVLSAVQAADRLG